MKRAWVEVVPWDKDLAIAAIEAGADALVVGEGDTPRVRELGALRTIAPDGDLRPGRDVLFMEIAGKEDEMAAAKAPGAIPVILSMTDWTVIPLENLIAQRENIFVEVRTEEEARLVAEVLEKGADGILVRNRDPAAVRRLVDATRSYAEPIELVTATITEVKALGMGDRVCIDTCTQMSEGEGILVGNTACGFFLIHAESVENPYVAARPFRVNAGAVHAYAVVAGGKTTYLAELKAGDEVLIVDYQGRTTPAFVGRCKIEKRPMMLIRAMAGEQEISLILQNAETIRLTDPRGKPLSIALLKPGDEVLAHVQSGGRHFGMKVEETLRER